MNAIFWPHPGSPRKQIVQFLRELAYLFVTRLDGHFQAGFSEEVSAVVSKGTLCIEGRRVHAVLIRKALTHHVEDIVVSVVRAQIIKRDKPASLSPQGSFIRTDCYNIEGAASRGNIYRQTLPQDVLTQHYPVQLDPALFFKFRGELLHQDHVGIVHRSNGQLWTPASRIENPHHESCARQQCQCFPNPVHKCHPRISMARVFSSPPGRQFSGYILYLISQETFITVTMPYNRHRCSAPTR
jgi:hypothetical protein